MSEHFKQISEFFFVEPEFEQALRDMGLTSIESVFAFTGGKNLSKENLAAHRSRLQFQTNSPQATLFLKRYERPPIIIQLKNWLNHWKRKSLAASDFEPAELLAKSGIGVPKTIAHGQRWGKIFEKRSFVITEEIADAQSLEKKLPDCFNGPATKENLNLRKIFVISLAKFIREFHETGFRHRDLYLCHIFYKNNGQFYLIDLARAFRPCLLSNRFRIKDIAQLYYSAPGEYFSKTDRLRFYLAYTDSDKLRRKDKIFLSRVKQKAKRMARHDIKHGRIPPFASGAGRT